MHLAFTRHQKALSGLKCWPKQAGTKRMMWLMDSDLVGLRPLTGAGHSLRDCSDLPIHQSGCDKAGALTTEGQPWPGRRELLYPLYRRHTSPYHWGENTVLLGQENRCPCWILIWDFWVAVDERCPHNREHILYKGWRRKVIWQAQCKQKWHRKFS